MHRLAVSNALLQVKEDAHAIPGPTSNQCISGALHHLHDHIKLRAPHTPDHKLTTALVHASDKHINQLALLTIEQCHTPVGTHLAKVKR